MWVIKVFVYYFLATCITEVKGESNCDKLGVLLYEDIGCKPVKRDNSDCPVKFECDDFSVKSDACLLRGKIFEPNEQVNSSITYPACKVGCFCNVEGGFTCAVLDCPEWLGSQLPTECYRKYETDGCCSVGKICPEPNTTVSTCTFEDQTVRVGERFTAKNVCRRCVCPENFNGKIEEPHCTRMTCNVQIDNDDKLQRNCAPFYYSASGEQSEALCCPYNWVCPSKKDKIIKINKNVKEDSDLTCKFGSKIVKLGEGIVKEVEFYGSKKKARCECILPPLLTCKEA